MSEPNDVQRLIPISKVHPWPGNPRKVFPEASIAALAESIKVQGILVPLLVRPNPKGRGRTPTEKAIETNLGMEAPNGYEIADGERRYRAALAAGLKVVPAVVRELSELEMYEVSLVSEGQREDLTPLDRADGLAKLVAYFDGKVEEAAARLGKSASALRAALRLKQLPVTAADALAAGELSLSVAELIAARPSADIREKAAAYALKALEFYLKGERVKERPSYREVKAWIAEHCMVELKQAPFEQKDASLTSAGACTSCPKKTGNNREEYPDGRADVCTDPVCFRAKVAAWQARLTAEATAKGQTVLSAAEAGRIFPHHSHLGYQSPYFDFKDQCYEDRGKKTPRSYKQLLEAHLQPADVILCLDPSNELHRLVKRDVALPILQKEHGLFKGATAANGSGGTSLEQAREEAKRRLDNAVAKRAESKLLEAAAAQGEAWGSGIAGWTEPVRALLAAVAARVARTVTSDHSLMVCKGRGLKLGSRQENEQALDAAAQGLTGPELLGLLAELLTASNVLTWSPGPDGKAVAKLLKLDRAAAEKEARAELKDKAPGSRRSNGEGKGIAKNTLPLKAPAQPPPPNGRPAKPRRAKATAAK